MQAKISRGTWTFGFGFDNPATVEQIVKGLAAFGYDGIEFGGFQNHVTLENYPDRKSRKELVKLVEGHGLEVAGFTPSPYGQLGKYQWAVAGDDAAVKAYKEFFDKNLQLCVDCGIDNMRIDPADLGPLPRDADYDRVWDRVVRMFREHAEQGASVGVKMLWELETGQIFVKPSEVVGILNEVDHPNLKFMYDVAHCEACCVLAHNQVQPVERLEGGQVEFIKMLKGHIGLVHLCDTDSNTYLNAFGTHLGFGDGVVDFDALMPAFLEGGYDNVWWSNDVIPMTTNWNETWDGRFFIDALLDRYVREPRERKLTETGETAETSGALAGFGS
jgi:sugar phosphate isomerase/epimerase